jgi:hypothetical protein
MSTSWFGHFNTARRWVKIMKLLITYFPLSLYLCVYSPLLDLGRFFSFLIFYRLLGRGISSSQGRYAHGTTQTQNKRRETSIPWVAFEPTIPLFEWAETVRALDGAATVIGVYFPLVSSYFMPPWVHICSAFRSWRASVYKYVLAISHAWILVLYQVNEQFTRLSFPRQPSPRVLTDSTFSGLLYIVRISIRNVATG